MRTVLFAFLTGLFLAIGHPSIQAAGDRPPNFIVIFCDDMGYADIGPFGAEGYETPHLDRMASEGMKFTDFYVSRSFCTPSRAALMTGCIPTRVGIGGNFGPHSKTGLHPDEMTIADVLKPLFDLENDIEETTNVAAEHPDIVERLRKHAEAMREELGDGKDAVGRERRPLGR